MMQEEEGFDKSKYGIQTKGLGDNLPGLKPEDEQTIARIMKSAEVEEDD